MLELAVYPWMGYSVTFSTKRKPLIDGDKRLFEAVNLGSVFRRNKQRENFLSLLADASDRFNADWHAYGLMDN